MAEHIWTVLCNKTLLDRTSNVLSMMDVAESVAVVGLEQLIKEALDSGKKWATINTVMQAVSWWFRSDMGEKVLQARFVLLGPDKESHLAHPIIAEWGEDKIFSRIFLDFSQLPVSMPGLHWLIVEQQKTSKGKKPKWDVMTRLPLYISEFKVDGLPTLS
jgi:hypothetical protein